MTGRRRGVQPRCHLSRRRPAVGDAVGNADAAEAAAGDEQSRMPGERAVDRRDALQMSDFVLRVAALEAEDAREQRLAARCRAAAQCARATARSVRRRYCSSASGSRAPPTKVRSSTRSRRARDAATSTTATRRRGCRCSRRAARRIPSRSADARRRRGGTRARRSRPTRSGISPHSAASSGSHVAQQARAVTYAGVATTTARASTWRRRPCAR